MLEHEGRLYLDTPGIDACDEDDRLAWLGLANADVIYEHLPHRLPEYGIHSGPQLAWHINALRAQKDFQAYLQQVIDEDSSAWTPSESIGQRLKLIRNVISYRLPRDIMALSKIQADVLTRRDIEPGGFGIFCRTA